MPRQYSVNAHDLQPVEPAAQYSVDSRTLRPVTQAAPEEVKSYLDGIPTSNRVRASAWDAVYSVPDDAAAEQLLRQLPLNNEVRATLWDYRAAADRRAQSGGSAVARFASMPRVLSEGEFNTLRDSVIAQAPTGLSEDDFNRWFQPRMAAAVGQAENSSAPVSGWALRRFVSNAASMLNPVAAVEGLATAVRHPVNTYNGMVDASAQQFSKAREAAQQNRYGEAIGHGVAGALPIVGPAAANAGEQIASGDIAGGAGAGTAQLALAGLAGPATRAVGRVLEAPAGAVAERLYQSALKPTKAVLQDVRAPGGPDAARQLLVQTGLNESIPVSARGAQKVGNLIDSLNVEVTKRLAAAKARGATVDPAYVDRMIQDVATEFTDQVNAQPDLAAVETVRQNFANNPRVSQPVYPVADGDVAATQPGPIPIDVAQRMKVNTYQGLRGKYGIERGATIEAEKAGARGLKEQIQTQAGTDVGDLNAREGRLIPLDHAIADAMRRRGNYGVFGLTPIVAASGAALTHGNVLPLLAAITDRMPGVVSRTGIWINRVGRRSGRFTAGAGRAAVAGNALQQDGGGQ